jgi:hypothetical protein
LLEQVVGVIQVAQQRMDVAEQLGVMPAHQFGKLQLSVLFIVHESPLPRRLRLSAPQTGVDPALSRKRHPGYVPIAFVGHRKIVIGKMVISLFFWVTIGDLSTIDR